MEKSKKSMRQQLTQDRIRSKISASILPEEMGKLCDLPTFTYWIGNKTSGPEEFLAEGANNITESVMDVPFL